ncbi:MAG: 30S ribosomal protein S6 [Acidimicrobiales bacterium]
MRGYELMVIIDSELDDAAVDAALHRIDEQISAKGAKVASLDKWGKRRFAYEINHKHDGHYAVYEIATDGGALGDLERQLRIADDVVRHKLIRLPDREAIRRGLVERKAPAPAGPPRGANDA